MTDETPENHSPLLWASYLGASWTWCIGMFLPVLLIRDYGPWAWVIFAVPNCVGAAAMGWVMRSRDQSVRYTRDHALACRLFSLVTIAFQLFFALWMLPRLVGNLGYIGAAIVVQAAFLPLVRTKHILFWSVLTLLGSAILAALLAVRGNLDIPAPLAVAPANLLGLALVCVLGFITCPYLDLTFHHARQQTSDAGAKIAFGVGFCVLFAAMIVFTFFYSPTIFRMTGISVWLLALHLMLQLTFTVYVHGRAIANANAETDESTGRAELGAALAVGLLAGLLAEFTRQNDMTYHGLAIGEVVYRMFMSFYGLVFPAYVVLTLTPSPGSPGEGWGEGQRLNNDEVKKTDEVSLAASPSDPHPNPLAEFRERERSVSLIAWALIVLTAMPFYWLAFIEAKMAWASAGVAIVVLGTLVANSIKSPARVSPSE